MKKSTMIVVILVMLIVAIFWTFLGDMVKEWYYTYTSGLFNVLG